MAYYADYPGSLGGALTPAVRFLLIATGVVFLLQFGLKLGEDPRFLLLFSLNAECLRNLWFWQLITYIFLHNGFWHVVLNMLGLFFFGPDTERALGSGRFAALYLGSGIVGGLGWLLLHGSQAGICLGASGAVFGVLGAFAALYPDRSVTLLVFFVVPVTMRARTMAIGLGLFSLLAAIGGPGQIAYAAHLAGGLAGYAYIRWMFRHGSAGALFDPRQWARGAHRAFHEARWRWQRRKFKVLPAEPNWENEAVPSPAEVDAILDKVSKWGVGRLSRREREILERAGRQRR